MALHVLRDPRAHLLTVMAVALIVLVPLMFVFIAMTEKVFSHGPSAAEYVVWALSGTAALGGLASLMVILARATRQSDAEHHPPRSDV